MDIKNILEEIKFDDRGLVPAVVQDITNNKVLMLAYMNKESIRKTFEEGIVYYYSRSREKLWKKGETSGNFQRLKGLYYDCDCDSLLVLVEQLGVACHTGHYSCFFNEVLKQKIGKTDIFRKALFLIGRQKRKSQRRLLHTLLYLEDG